MVSWIESSIGCIPHERNPQNYLNNAILPYFEDFFSKGFKKRRENGRNLEHFYNLGVGGF